MKTKIRDEREGEILGVPGRFMNVIIWPQTGELANQTWISERRRWEEPSKRIAMQVEIRHDDNCKNGHPSFAITATGWENGRESFGGCCHELIAKHFPELQPLIQWHLCSTDGPMHYIANAVYHAGDRDHYGRRAGDVASFDHAVQFGDVPIKHKLRKSFAQFLKDGAGHGFDFEVIQVAHENRHNYATKFAPKYTLGGYGKEWHECPFDTEGDAVDFLEALQTCAPRFLTIPTAWSEGKPRDLAAARSVAIWPDATDVELMQEPDRLKVALAKRLPHLLKQFRADVEGIGFIWSALPD